MGNPVRTGVGGVFANRLFELDRILRGDATRLDALVRTEDGEAEFQIPVVGVSVTVIGLAVVYGFCMGTFALVRGAEQAEYAQACLQTFASMCKVPLLFLLTLIVTFPSLYVFNALVGSRLQMTAVLKLLVASLAVNLAVLASMGPILAFFSVSTPNYGFIVLLNVLVFTVAGVLGLAFLIQTMGRLTASYKRLAIEARKKVTQRAGKSGPMKMAHLPAGAPDVASPPTTSSQARQAAVATTRTMSPLDSEPNVVLGRHVWKVFWCWLVVFSLVGAQMGWVLRPFIGAPNTPFQWFRPRHSNFFEAVLNVIQNLFS
jgi:hypothetical protein